MMARDGSGGWMKAAALLAALTVAACISSEVGAYPEPPEPHARVVSVPTTLSAALPLESGDFASPERHRLAAFLDAYRDGGRGPLKAAINAPDATAAARAETALRALAQRRGVVEDALVVTVIFDGVPGLTLGYTDFVAVPPPCDPEVVMSRNPTAKVSPNLGCALERSLTAVLAHPADYLSPAGEGPADGVRMDRVLELYRAGKAPQADVNRNDELKPLVSK